MNKKRALKVIGAKKKSQKEVKITKKDHEM